MSTLSTTDTIRIVTATNRTIVKHGLHLLLEKTRDITITGEVDNYQDVQPTVYAQQPDILLLDVAAGDETPAIEITRAVHAGSPQTQVIILANNFSSSSRRLVQAGANGYLLNDITRAQLLVAIRHVHYGQPIITMRLFNLLRGAPIDLTDCEQSVLTLMVQGMSNRTIAARLQLGRNTIKTHVSNILAKLGACNRAEAVYQAAQHGWGAMNPET